MTRLELTFKFTHLSRPYKVEIAYWPDHNVEFWVRQGEDGKQVGYFKTWIDDVAPEAIKDAFARMEGKVDQFALGMKFLGNYRLSWDKIDLRYQSGDNSYMIKHDVDIELIIRRSKGEMFNYINSELPRMTSEINAQVQPSALPAIMPFVPSNMKRHILTFTQAMELDGLAENYADEQLKRWFLILEELESIKDSDDYKAIMQARHFASHSVCDKKLTLKFIKEELPAAISLDETGNEIARFDRHDPSHMALVCKYERKARQRAISLITREIDRCGGIVTR